MKKKINPFAASAKSLIQNEHSKRSGLRDFDVLKTKISPYSNFIHEFIFTFWKNAKFNEISKNLCLKQISATLVKMYFKALCYQNVAAGSVGVQHDFREAKKSSYYHAFLKSCCRLSGSSQVIIFQDIHNFNNYENRTSKMKF